MIRPSSTPVSLYCGLAGRLAAAHPEANRSAFMSSVFHELCAAGDSKRTDLLSDDELEEIQTWRKPADVQPSRGPLLKYSEAQRELRLAMSPYFEACAVDDPELLTVGTLDFCWLVTAKDGTKVVFVCDIKRTRYTASDGPRNPQNLTYCWLAAAHFKADAYCPGLWIAEDGNYNWSDQITKVESDAGRRDMRLVRAALKNDTGEACTGSHCNAAPCYARLHCPAYTGPATRIEALSPALEQRLSEENALAALTEVERLEDMAERARDNLKAWVLRGGVLKNEDGRKRWMTIISSGRKSLNRELLTKKVGESVVAECTTVGKDFTTHRWVKA